MRQLVHSVRLDRRAADLTQNRCVVSTVADCLPRIALPDCFAVLPVKAAERPFAELLTCVCRRRSCHRGGSQARGSPTMTAETNGSRRESRLSPPRPYHAAVVGADSEGLGATCGTLTFMPKHARDQLALHCVDNVDFAAE
jgi:hypothetical protein